MEIQRQKRICDWFTLFPLPASAAPSQCQFCSKTDFILIKGGLQEAFELYISSFVSS